MTSLQYLSSQTILYISIITPIPTWGGDVRDMLRCDDCPQVQWQWRAMQGLFEGQAEGEVMFATLVT
jgi:hypothetical protein